MSVDAPKIVVHDESEVLLQNPPTALQRQVIALARELSHLPGTRDGVTVHVVAEQDGVEQRVSATLKDGEAEQTGVVIDEAPLKKK